LALAAGLTAQGVKFSSTLRPSRFEQPRSFFIAEALMAHFAFSALQKTCPRTEQNAPLFAQPLDLVFARGSAFKMVDAQSVNLHGAKYILKAGGESSPINFTSSMDGEHNREF
jgi:hypothetical protein